MMEQQLLNRDTLKQLIFDLLADIAPEADFDTLDLDEDIRLDLDIDSFDFLNLLIGLNEATGIEIPEADYGKLVSVNDICRYILG